MLDNLPPKVSIILLNYNGAKDTIDCLKSLTNISYGNYNIVIVDNLSTDDSIIEIEAYLSSNGSDYTMASSSDEALKNEELHAKLTVLKTDHNGGYGYGNNVGIKFALAHGADYVLIINNDTVVEPDFLNPMVMLCEEDGNIGIVSGKIYFYDKPDVIWFNGGKYYPYTAKVVHVNFNEKETGQKPPEDITFISGCLWLIPGKIIDRVGLINEEYFMYVEDLEFCCRVLRESFSLRVCEESIIYHKVGGSSGGHLSEFSIYWTSRNHCKLIKSEQEKMSKLCAYLYLIFFKSLKMALKGNYKLLKCHLSGLYDAFK